MVTYDRNLRGRGTGLGWDCDWDWDGDWAVEVGSKTSPGSGSEPSNNRPHSMDGKGNLMETNQ